MTEQSKVTLQPLPTLEKVIDEMLTTYMDERGYGDFFDSYKTVATSDLKQIGLALYERMCEMSDKAMIKNGRCPECGGKLARVKYFHQPEIIECQDCHDEVREVG